MVEDVPDWAKSPTIDNPDTDVFLSYLKHIICSGDVGKYDYFLKYLYYIIFKQKKTGICPVLFGDNNVGKSLFIKKIGELLGERTNFFSLSNITDIARVDINYHTALLLYCDEVCDVKKALYEYMKNYITDDNQSVKVSICSASVSFHSINVYTLSIVFLYAVYMYHSL